MIEAKIWYKELKVENALTSLRKNGFKTIYVSNKKDVVSKILDLVPLDALVGFGGSVTLRELNLPKILRERGNRVADHWVARQNGASVEEILEIRRLQLNSDIFITSTNAITETGQLINTDGGGQRVAAMIFGPKKVIIIAGINKLVRTVDDGLRRVKNMAAPMNAKRLNRNTPCVITGICNDCDSNERICSVTSIIHRRPSLTKVSILLVGEDLGY